jgi:AcrR family transcriptional regulator
VKKANGRRRKKIPLAEKMEAKKEAIFDAALALFASRGFDGTPVGELADKAGVAAGTIYRYFADKEALVNGLYLHWKQQFLRNMQDGFPATATVREQFRWIWFALDRFRTSWPQAFAFLEMHYHASYLDEASKKIEEEVMVMFRTFIAHGQKIKVLKPIDADLLIALVFGAFTNIVKQQALGRLDLTGDLLGVAEAACWDLVAQ